MIPARYHSTRLPGKPLLEIAGRPMIAHVAARAARARNVGRVIVATDDVRVCDAVVAAGFEAVMTRADHCSGSDRIAEVAAKLDDVALIVNVQGDEPLISPLTIEQTVEALCEDEAASVATCCERIATADDLFDPNVVKVVVNERGRALYFSRAPVPLPRDSVRRHGSLVAALEAEPHLLTIFRKHVGLYVYRREFLLEFARRPPSPLELLEALEQLRALEMGAQIAVVEVDSSAIGVDTPDDLVRVRALVAADDASRACVETVQSDGPPT
ncbi:MAG: 3-deoxy-manno-octulosonate cytidylyltransferase [Pyrinomonas sp.]